MNIAGRRTVGRRFRNNTRQLANAGGVFTETVCARHQWRIQKARSEEGEGDVTLFAYLQAACGANCLPLWWSPSGDDTSRGGFSSSSPANPLRPLDTPLRGTLLPGCCLLRRQVLPKYMNIRPAGQTIGLESFRKKKHVTTHNSALLQKKSH